MADVKKDGQNQETPKKKKGGGGMVAVFIILCLIIAAGVACFYLDVAGSRTKTAEFLMPKKSEIEVETDEIRWRREYEQKEAEMAEKTQALENRENELNQRDAALAEAERQMELLRKSVDEKNNELDSIKKSVRDVAKIYEEMEAVTAAKVLMSYEDKNEVARIMKNLSDEQAAAILTEMQPKYAAGLLHIVDDVATGIGTDTNNNTDTDIG